MPGIGGSACARHRKWILWLAACVAERARALTVLRVVVTLAAGTVAVGQRRMTHRLLMLLMMMRRRLVVLLLFVRLRWWRNGAHNDSTLSHWHHTCARVAQTKLLIWLKQTSNFNDKTHVHVHADAEHLKDCQFHHRCRVSFRRTHRAYL